MSYKFLNHSADVQVEIKEKNIKNIFINSIQAIKEIICEEKIKPLIEKKLTLHEENLEELFHSFLDEVIFLFDSEGFLVSKLKKIKINEKKNFCEAILIGDKKEKYKIHSHIKAATYYKFFLKKEKKDWIGKITFDV